MKRKTRKILMVLAMATISAFGVLFASCGVGDWLNEKVDQLTCKHEYDDGIELESATCSEYGKVLKTCTICHYEKEEKIDKLPHTETVVAAVAPTCTKDGKTDGVVCSVCDEIIVRQKSVPKLGHDITILEAVEPTCLTSGKTEGQYCNRCNETVVEQKTISALGHKVVTTYGKAATCTEDGLTNGQKCVRCDTVYVAQEVIPATGHTLVDYECTVCGVSDVSALATLDSNLVKVETLSAGTSIDYDAIYRLSTDMENEQTTVNGGANDIVFLTSAQEWELVTNNFVFAVDFGGGEPYFDFQGGFTYDIIGTTDSDIYTVSVSEGIESYAISNDGKYAYFTFKNLDYFDDVVFASNWVFFTSVEKVIL